MYGFNIGQAGSVEVVKWVIETKKFTRSDWIVCIEGAANGGHLEVLKLISIGAKKRYLSAAASHAAENNHIHILEWLHTNNNIDDDDLDEMFTSALLENNVQVARFIRSIMDDGHIIDDEYSSKIWDHVLENGNS